MPGAGDEGGGMPAAWGPVLFFDHAGAPSVARTHPKARLAPGPALWLAVCRPGCPPAVPSAGCCRGEGRGAAENCSMRMRAGQRLWLFFSLSPAGSHHAVGGELRAMSSRDGGGCLRPLQALPSLPSFLSGVHGQRPQLGPAPGLFLVRVRPSFKTRLNYAVRSC